MDDNTELEENETTQDEVIDTKETESDSPYKSVTELVTLLKKVLKARDFDIEDDDDVILQYEIERAISTINRCRRFDTTDEKPYDLKYRDMIIPLAITSFAKIGVEGQTRHSENGVTRSYTTGGDYPKDMLNEIIPLIK